MFNKHKIWFHSSRVKFPLVSMSASWFLVSMYLIWILESKLIRSKKPIKSNSVGSGNMSQCRASSLYDHLDHCFVVFKHKQKSFLMRRSDVRGNKINTIQIIDHPLRLLAFVNRVRWRKSFTFGHNGSLRSIVVLSRVSKNWNNQIHKWRARIPSKLNPASKEMISDSVQLCESEVCFLHIQLIGTNVWLPKTHNVPPEVDLESSRSHRKSESWNSPSLHCFEVLPT